MNHPAFNASAENGYMCANCHIDSEPCPICYRVWWQAKHPNTQLVCSDDSEVFAANRRAEQAEADKRALEQALERLGSMEAFGLPRMVNRHDYELLARINFARAAIERNSHD